MERITSGFGKVKKGRGEPLRLSSGKSVGRLFGDEAEFPVRRSRHFFRAIGGYSLDAAVIAELQRRGVRLVAFKDKELGERYAVALSTFIAHAQRINYGFGDKLACPERFYREAVPPIILPGFSDTCRMPSMGLGS